MALKDSFHSQCLTLSNGYRDQSFPVNQDVKSEISHILTVLNQWNEKEISLFPSYDYFLTTDASESGAGATLKKGKKITKTWSFQWSTTQSKIDESQTIHQSNLEFQLVIEESWIQLQFGQIFGLGRSSDLVKWSFNSLDILLLPDAKLLGDPLKFLDLSLLPLLDLLLLLFHVVLLPLELIHLLAFDLE
ncbi:hypothetical protein ACTFIR_005751 [Dictyostelium discoideum]